jgi:hypothetical protein
VIDRCDRRGGSRTGRYSCTARVLPRGLPADSPDRVTSIHSNGLVFAGCLDDMEAGDRRARCWRPAWWPGLLPHRRAACDGYRTAVRPVTAGESRRRDRSGLCPAGLGRRPRPGVGRRPVGAAVAGAGPGLGRRVRGCGMWREWRDPGRGVRPGVGGGPTGWGPAALTRGRGRAPRPSADGRHPVSVRPARPCGSGNGRHRMDACRPPSLRPPARFRTGRRPVRTRAGQPSRVLVRTRPYPPVGAGAPAPSAVARGRDGRRLGGAPGPDAAERIVREVPAPL